MNEFRQSFLFFTGLFLGICILILFGIVYAITPFHSQTTLETIKSPDQQHEIIFLRAVSSSTALQHETHHIDMEHHFNGRSNTTKEIHIETDSDGDHRYKFENIFIKRGWRDSNTFVLSSPTRRHFVSRTVKIVNHSASAIDALTIFGDEIYTVVAIQQNSTIEIPVKWKKRSGIFTCGVSTVVHFANGKGIRRKHLAFQFSSAPVTESEWLDGKRENVEDCVNGTITVGNKKVDYSILPPSA